jgi:hypothetical protein
MALDRRLLGSSGELSLFENGYKMRLEVALKVQLVLGDYIKHNPAIATAIDTANEIIKWFNNHSYARGLLKQELRTMGMPPLLLLAACLTRWTAHYCAVTCLLQVGKALQSLVLKRHEELIDSAGRKLKLQEKAASVLDYVEDRHLWTR